MAYSYEIELDAIWEDWEYDALSLSIDITTPTGNDEMDNFFRENFLDFTGMWVENHPHQDRLAEICKGIRSAK